MRTNKIHLENIEIETLLYDFVNQEVLPGTGLEAKPFWSEFAALIQALAPQNAKLLDKRDRLQQQIDAWYRQNPGIDFDRGKYKSFLVDIGYLSPNQGPVTVVTENVDVEIAHLAAPQLVVPVNNARYALNAANARWGSLYDALYGTDAIAQQAMSTAPYDAQRGAKVVQYVRTFLDQHFPLTQGSHREAQSYQLSEPGLEIELSDGTVTTLKNPNSFVGYTGPRESPTELLLVHHGLHVEIHIDRSHKIGSVDSAGISDVILESALTTIQDCEDSVAAVNTEEKLVVYRNWLGLMQGDLAVTLDKNGKPFKRRLNLDRYYTTPSGENLVLPGRSLMLIRNVGAHMLTHMITLDSQPIPETIVDAVITSLISLHDFNPAKLAKNSLRKSIYIVKPKMHGPEEVAFAGRLFDATEDLLRLPRYTIKIGIMDEERRTTVNLAECIRAVRQRLAFINTGFLDRTGDEIHTSMEAGAVPRKHELKQAIWLQAYERQNVDIGLKCGLPGHAQIGKGMWATPDLMADMLATKIAQPLAGASTAWVPSPTAATLHALHYHLVDVTQVQATLKTRPQAALEDILTPPLTQHTTWSTPEIEQELNINTQSILGYVVRWIDFGIGCSKVPDFLNVALMEDRATLRISSQHIANWLHHQICSHDQVIESLKNMAVVVDRQNSADPNYQSMSRDFTRSIAFKAASDLVFMGRDQPNGYTEAILHARRKEKLMEICA